MSSLNFGLKCHQEVSEKMNSMINGSIYNLVRKIATNLNVNNENKIKISDVYDKLSKLTPPVNFPLTHRSAPPKPLVKSSSSGKSRKDKKLLPKCQADVTDKKTGKTQKCANCVKTKDDKYCVVHKNYSLNKCKHVLTTGKNKDSLCDKRCKNDNIYCNKHIKMYETENNDEEMEVEDENDEDEKDEKKENESDEE